MSPCALGEMGKCLSPCDGSVSLEVYGGVVTDLRSALTSAPDPVIAALTSRMNLLAAAERFEDAGTVRDRLAAFVRSASRTQRLHALTRCSELVAARRDDDRRWGVHVVRHGLLGADRAGRCHFESPPRAPWLTSRLDFSLPPRAFQIRRSRGKSLSA